MPTNCGTIAAKLISKGARPSTCVCCVRVCACARVCVHVCANQFDVYTKYYRALRYLSMFIRLWNPCFAAEPFTKLLLVHHGAPCLSV